MQKLLGCVDREDVDLADVMAQRLDEFPPYSSAACVWLCLQPQSQLFFAVLQFAPKCLQLLSNSR